MKIHAISCCLGLCLFVTAAADPLHVRPDGSYWHHDSQWVFPAKVGEFVRVGIPQDIAGSREATAWYALEIDGARVVASVEVQEAGSPRDSARAVLFEREVGEWVVRLYVQVPPGITVPPAALDDFVNAQPWDSLTS